MTDTNKIDDGGNAFPIQASEASGAEYAHVGMTLRDYFAAAAIDTLYSRVTRGNEERQMEACARVCYQIADAMIKARSEGKS